MEKIFQSKPCNNQVDAVKDCIEKFNSYFADKVCTLPHLELKCEVVHSDNSFKIVAQLIVNYV